MHQQPFGRQLERNSAAVQRAAQHPLRSVGKEEELLLTLQKQERETERAQRNVAAVQHNLEQTKAELEETKSRLQQLELACRASGVQDKVVKAMGEAAGHMARLQQERGEQPQHSQHLLSRKDRDIRVHGGSGALNQFAFGSDELQQLLAKHKSDQPATHGRRSSLSMENQANQDEEHASAEERREQWRRQNMARTREQQADKQQYDIFGNVVKERVVPALPRQEPESNDLFSGMGTNRSHARGRTDLRSDKFLANRKMWGGRAAAGTAEDQRPV